MRRRAWSLAVPFLVLSCSVPPAVEPPAAGGAGEPAPGWVRTGRSEAHPDGRYLQAVGSAPLGADPAAAREAAEQKARAALVRVFFSRVHSELRVHEVFRAVDDAARTDLTMTETVSVVGEGTLEGAQVAAWHDGGGAAHCLLVLDRAAAAAEIARRVRQHDADAAALLRRAQGEATPGAALALLLQAHDAVRKARILRVSFAVLGGAPQEQGPDAGQSVLAALHARAGALRLGAQSGSGQQARIGRPLGEALVARLTDAAGEGIGGVDLRFEPIPPAKAELSAGVVATDAAGCAHVAVRAVGASGERANQVRCEVAGLVERGLPGPAATFDYLLPTPATTRVLVLAQATALGTPHAADGLTAGVQDALAAAGYAVLGERAIPDVPRPVLAGDPPAVVRARLAGQVDFLVRIEATTSDAGARRDRLRARATALVEVIEVESGGIDRFAADPGEGQGDSHAAAAAASLIQLGSAVGRMLRERLDGRLGR